MQSEFVCIWVIKIYKHINVFDYPNISFIDIGVILENNTSVSISMVYLYDFLNVQIKSNEI